MSSFRRKTPISSSANPSPDVASSANQEVPAASISIGAGVKPTVHNSLGMVSSGHSQLDELLGGGLQLGTTFLIGTDLYSHYGETLLSYGMAEALSMNQQCLLLASNQSSADQLLSTLPYNRVLGTNVESKKSQYCYSYDLSRSIQPTLLESNASTGRSGVKVFCGIQSNEKEQLQLQDMNIKEAISCIENSYVQAVIEFVNTMNTNGTVGRIFLYNIHEILSQQFNSERLDNINIDLFLTNAFLLDIGKKLLLKIKMICRSSRVVVVSTVIPEALPGSNTLSDGKGQYQLSSNSTEGGTTSSIIESLILVSDSAITIDSFAGKQELVPYEFKEFCGFLIIERIQHIGTLVSYRPRALRFGLKRDRRKLHIEPLHLPPEESRAQGSAGTDARLEARSKNKQNEVEQNKVVLASTLSLSTASASASALVLEATPESAPVISTTAPTKDRTAVAISVNDTAGGGDTTAPRQYKRLNFGQTRAPGPIGGVTISHSVKKKANTPAVAPGSVCGAGAGKDTRLDF
jgi:elongator complex protein 4